MNCTERQEDLPYITYQGVCAIQWSRGYADKRNRIDDDSM